MNSHKILLSIITLGFLLLAGCQEKTYMLDEVIKEAGQEFEGFQISEEAAVQNMNLILKEENPDKVNQFIQLTEQVELKKISSKEAEEFYKGFRGPDRRVLMVALGDAMIDSTSFFIYTAKDGTVLVTQFEDSLGKHFYIKTSESAGLFNKVLDYYKANFQEQDQVHILDSLEE